MPISFPAVLSSKKQCILQEIVFNTDHDGKVVRNPEKGADHPEIPRHFVLRDTFLFLEVSDCRQNDLNSKASTFPVRSFNRSVMKMYCTLSDRKPHSESAR